MKIKKRSGQISVFLGMSLLVILSLLAFVINVGLFVKAKINLQNAVDSAAYAGAAVQARQLTNIGYLNWEIRNVMKEWLYKYYVIGQLGNNKVVLGTSAGNVQDFRPKPFDLVSNPNDFARYNIPRICLSFGGTKNICNIYGIPGLPRFDTSGEPIISEITEQFTNTAVTIKSKNCATRSELNFGAALAWTYGHGDASLMPNSPQLLLHRPGAWPRALELGIRMRNLEYIVNRPPISEGICISSQSGCIGISELQTGGANTPINERPIKAFMSAFRNLGGGSQGVNGGNDHFSIKNTLKLTELVPQPLSFTPKEGLTGYLIPDGATYPGAGKYEEKHYLDLTIVPINYAVFFTTFTAKNESGDVSFTGVDSEGACGGSATGIPVPSYITGFVKNPEVLTYYAVKAEARYVGLFFPFTKTEGIKIQAYAAAKPFGGRIGPRFFKKEDDLLMPRSDATVRSKGYAAGVLFDTGTDPTYRAGLPVPYVDSFFVTNENQPVGGTPAASSSVEMRFSIPNMIYDITSNMKDQVSGSKLTILKAAPDDGTGPAGDDVAGLFFNEQFEVFKNNLNTTNLGLTEIESKVIRSKRATKYDAINYLVPSRQNEENQNDAPSVVFGEERTVGNESYLFYNLFAPLCGDLYLYGCEATEKLEAVMSDFLQGSGDSIKIYLEALASVAQSMRDQATAGAASDNLYTEAANSIFATDDKTEISTPFDVSTGCDGMSLAKRFHIFFNEHADIDDTEGLASCGEVPLLTSANLLILEKAKSAGDDVFKNYYTAEYYTGGSEDRNFAFTAYAPGERQGANSDGKVRHPFTGGTEPHALRNYYSTKHIWIKKVTEKQGDPSYGALFPYAESYTGSLSTGLATHVYPSFSGIHNTIDPTVLNEFEDFSETY